MYDLRDTTFLIPVRIDNDDRLRNLLLLIKYLVKHLATNICILECANRQKFDPSLVGNKIKYKFVKDIKPYFKVTSARNTLTRLAETPYVGIWDVDLVIPVLQIVKAIDILRSKQFHVVYPYDGRMYDTPPHHISVFSQTLDTSVLSKFKSEESLMFGNCSVGGGFFAEKESYCAVGMENENIQMWGADDSERYRRFRILGLKVTRLDGIAFHLNHPRRIAHPNASFFFKSLVKSKEELLKVSNMTQNELLDYIRQGNVPVKQMM